MYYDCIPISKINDFIFCPNSIYLHSIYEDFDNVTYHSLFQKRGKIHHQAIDHGYYSSSKHLLQGLPVYSRQLNIIGNIDIYDIKNQLLIERKYHIKKLFDGQKLQVYAQAVCLSELNYKINKICLHSLKDNKRYFIPYPDKQLNKLLLKIILQIQKYNPKNLPPINVNKCKQCIYSTLCMYYKNDNLS